jgi:signal transduction histidine kinase
MNVSFLVICLATALSFILNTVFGLWVYLKSSRKPTSRMFLLMTLATGIAQISYLFGTSVADPEASRQIFTMQVTLVFSLCFMAHWIMLALERRREYGVLVGSLYVVGAAVAGVFLAWPEQFLQMSAHKLYFPEYYVAGPLYILLPAFFAVGFAAICWMLWRSHRTSDAVHKNRILYYFVATVLAYPVAAIGFLLAYGIEVDPIWAVLSNLSIVPLAYAVLRYDAMSIGAAARKALAYFALVGAAALFFLASQWGEELLRLTHPGAPGWIVPLVSALVIVALAGYLWERMRDLEVLKYEFVNVVTHKFRTPLTRIKWATELLRKEEQGEQGGGQNDGGLEVVGEIEGATESLVELTDMLVALRSASDASYGYGFEAQDVCSTVEKAVRAVQSRIREKTIGLSLSCPPQAIFASIDSRRMSFALQILCDNAAAYTPQGGSVRVSVSERGDDALISVVDSGIGISREDLPHVFEKFWRSKEAKAADTEGMGIGLYMAREIVQRHGGDISVSSEGLGKGAVFTVRLPLAAKE